MACVMGEGLTGLVFDHNAYYKLISALQTKNNRIYYIFTLLLFQMIESTWVVALLLTRYLTRRNQILIYLNLKEKSILQYVFVAYHDFTCQNENVWMSLTEK